MKRPKIGTRIESTHILRRGYNDLDLSFGRGYQKKWFRIDWHMGNYKGYYIGCRTFTNGAAGMPAGKDGFGYTPNERFEAWLIVPNGACKPIPILPSDAIIIGD